MDQKEKQRNYYLKNRERILEQSKKYYYDNIEERKEYNRNYWDKNKDKYMIRRTNDERYKTQHRLYYHHYYKIKEEMRPTDVKPKMKDFKPIDNTLTTSLTVYFN